MRKLSLALALVCLCWSTAASAVPIQWSVASGGNGNWYEHVSIAMEWHAAKTFSENRSYLGLQGHLVTITSAAEGDFLLVNGLVPTETWIGAFQDLSAPDFSEPSGGWRWVTGEPWDYENWFSWQPDNSPHDEDFVEIHTTGNWNDLPTEGSSFTDPRPVLVEYSTPIPEPSTALLLGIGMMGLGMRRIRTRGEY